MLTHMRKMLIPYTLLAGVAAGLLRAFEWRLAWDRELGLMAPHHFLSILLLGVSLLFALALLLIAERTAPGTPPASAPVAETPKRPLMWADAVAVLALYVSAGLDIREFISSLAPGGPAQGTSALLFGIFSLFAGVCILLISVASGKGMPGRAYGLYMLVPVFWACFWLIRNISKYAINPVPLSYLYDMLATIFTLLALYAAAGFFFSHAHPGRTRVYCMLGVYFALVTLFGLGLHWLLWGSMPIDFLRIGDLSRFVFAIFHLPAIVRLIPLWMSSRRTPVGEGNKEPEEESTRLVTE